MPYPDPAGGAAAFLRQRDLTLTLEYLHGCCDDDLAAEDDDHRLDDVNRFAYNCPLAFSSNIAPLLRMTALSSCLVTSTPRITARFAPQTLNDKRLSDNTPWVLRFV